MGWSGSTQADLELSDAAKLDGTGSIFIGRGSTSAVDDAQRARVSLAGRSMITNLNGNIYLATNNYGRAEKGVKRLGVWRAALRGSYKAEEFASSGPKSFTSAQTTVRYDNFALAALRDEDGNFRPDQRIALYQHNGGWKKVASLPVEAAEADHRIAGTLLPADDDWNLGFFAVVAEIPRGTVLTVR